MVNVAIVGNCQAQALEAMFLMYSDWNIARIPAVHLLTKDQEEETKQKLGSVDYIFSQRVTDDYPVSYLRTNDLKKKYNNVISWPNIYFNGYFPDIEYMYRENIGKLVGPLDDYHMRLVHYFYAQGKTVEDCVYLYGSDYFESYYPHPIERSIAALKGREAGLDIQFSEYLDAIVRERKCFYTVNHPANFVLFEMARRMAAAIGHDVEFPFVHPFALARVNIPVYPAIRRKYQLQHIADESFVGIGRHSILYALPDAQAKVYNDLTELIELFYRFYDSVEPQ